MRKRVLPVLLSLMLFGLAPIASASTIVNLDRVGSGHTNVVFSWDRFLTSFPSPSTGANRQYQSIGAQDTQVGLPPISMLFAESAIGPDPSLALDLTVPTPTPGVKSDLVTTRVNCDGCGEVASGTTGSNEDSGAGAATIPEPATLGLMALALVGIGRHLRRSRA
jgi:PEP-CTERM motif